MARRGHRRWLIARVSVCACVGVALATALAGCGAAADGPFPHPAAAGGAEVQAAKGPALEPLNRSAVSGEVVVFTGSSPVEAKIMRKLIARFEQTYPKIDVRFTAINRDYPTVVLTRFAGGDPPDLFTVDGKFFSDWASKGLLMPLDPYIERQQVDMDRYLPPLRASVRRANGSTYALPLNFSTVALFINDDMFAKAGIAKAPTTWAELERDARKLTIAKGAPGAVGNQSGLCLIPSWERMLLFALQQDGGITNRAGTSMTVTSPQTQIAVDWVQRMLKSKAATSPETLGASWCGDAFGRQKVAMALEGAWMLPPLQRQFPDVKWSVHPLPVGARPATLAYSGNMGIARTAKNPDAAWLLLEHLASPWAQGELAKVGLGVPSMTGVDYPPRLAPFAKGIEHATVWSLPPGFFNTVLITADNEMSAVLEGKQTVPGMLHEIDAIGSQMLKASPQ